MLLNIYFSIRGAFLGLLLEHLLVPLIFLHLLLQEVRVLGVVVELVDWDASSDLCWDMLFAHTADGDSRETSWTKVVEWVHLELHLLVKLIIGSLLLVALLLHWSAAVDLLVLERVEVWCLVLEMTNRLLDVLRILINEVFLCAVAIGLHETVVHLLWVEVYLLLQLFNSRE